MAVPDAKYLTNLNPKYLGHTFRVGPVAEPQTGAAITGGAAGTFTTFTNLNDSGPGSLRDTLGSDTYLVPAAGLHGTLNIASDLLFDQLSNFTIDLRGHDIDIDATNENFGLRFTDCFNFIVMNGFVHDADIDNLSCGNKPAGAEGSNHYIIAMMKLQNAGDESFELRIRDNANIGFDCMVAYVRWLKGTSPFTSEKDLIIFHNNNDNNPDGFRCIMHHNFFDTTHSRHPLFGPDQSGTPDDPSSGQLWQFNDYIKWQALHGSSVRGGCRHWAENCTYDADNASPNEDQAHNRNLTGTDGQLEVTGARYLNGASGDANGGTVVDPTTLFTVLDDLPHATSAAEDTEEQQRSGNVYQVEQSGTLHLSEETDVIGKTLILEYPDTHPVLPAAGAAFNAIRASIIDDIQIIRSVTGETLAVGTDLWVVVDVVRTADRIVTLTASLNPTLSNTAIAFYRGTSLTTEHLFGWNEQTILAVVPVASPPDPNSPALNRYRSLSSAYAKNVVNFVYPRRNERLVAPASYRRDRVDPAQRSPYSPPRRGPPRPVRCQRWIMVFGGSRG